MRPAVVPLETIYDELFDHVVGFAQEGASVADHLGVGDAAQLFNTFPPEGIDDDDLFAVMTVSLPATGRPTETGISVEIMVFGKPREQLSDVRALGDLLQDALRDLYLGLSAASGGGAIRLGSPSRYLVPQGSGEVDGTVVQERHTVDGWVLHRAIAEV